MSSSVSRPKTDPVAAPASSARRAPLEIPEEKIAMRAYEKWVERGRPVGDDLRDWHEAEAELRQELARPERRPRR